MRPEQRLAQRIVDMSGLEPPIDIRAIINEFADVEEAVLPANLDAILIRTASARLRPRIVLNPNPHENRQRFTLSHELAHLRLPWHIGTVWCHTDWANQADEGIHFATEDEANWFAASLLMPPSWLRVIANTDAEIDEKFRSTLTADVSPQAAAISLFDVLPPGFAYAIVSSSSQTVIQAGKSRNTAVDKMWRNTAFSDAFYQGTSNRHFTLECGWACIHLWSFATTVEMPTFVDGILSKNVLREIVTEVLRLPEQQAQAQRSISAITGAAFGEYEATSAKQLLAILSQKFIRRDGVVAMCAGHPRFPEYLARRADELFRKRL